MRRSDALGVRIGGDLLMKSTYRNARPSLARAYNCNCARGRVKSARAHIRWLSYVVARVIPGDYCIPVRKKNYLNRAGERFSALINKATRCRARRKYLNFLTAIDLIKRCYSNYSASPNNRIKVTRRYDKRDGSSHLVSSTQDLVRCGSYDFYSETKCSSHLSRTDGEKKLISYFVPPLLRLLDVPAAENPKSAHYFPLVLSFLLIVPLSRRSRDARHCLSEGRATRNAATGRRCPTVKITEYGRTWEKDGRRKKDKAAGNEQLRAAVISNKRNCIVRRKAPRQRSHYHRHANRKRYKRVSIHTCLHVCACAHMCVYELCMCDLHVCAFTRVCERTGVRRLDTRACSVSCKYEYYRVVYMSSLQGHHYPLTSLREPGARVVCISDGRTIMS